jgi:hypothetical protein
MGLLSAFSAYRMLKKAISKFRELTGEIKTKVYSQETLCRRCVLAALRTVKLGLNKVRNQAKPLKYSEKKNCISNQLRADVQTYGHQTRYTADNDTAETALRAVCFKALCFKTEFALKECQVTA